MKECNIFELQKKIEKVCMTQEKKEGYKISKDFKCFINQKETNKFDILVDNGGHSYASSHYIVIKTENGFEIQS